MASNLSLRRFTPSHNDHLVRIERITEDEITFSDGSQLLSEHEQDCCENHYLSFADIKGMTFDGHLFDLTKDDFFEKIDGYGIALLPKIGHPIRIPGYGSNNGYYSSNLTLRLVKGDVLRTFDITECQVIEG